METSHIKNLWVESPALRSKTLTNRTIIDCGNILTIHSIPRNRTIMTQNAFLPLLALFALTTFVASTAIGSPPNFIFILADDQGWNALSIPADPDEPASGSPYFQTPHLAKLAVNGMRFSQAYSPAPTCSPTQHSIQFGRSPSSLRTWGADGIRNWNAIDGESLANVLKKARPAYVCSHFGK
jgi:arylsulfatase A